MSDGGPAFPQYFVYEPDKGQYGQYTSADEVGFGGMSLRDWFAGMALAALLRTPSSGEDYKTMGEMSYQLADAMLTTRKAKEGK